jgi:ankyrin repeat protein
VDLAGYSSPYTGSTSSGGNVHRPTCDTYDYAKDLIFTLDVPPGATIWFKQTSNEYDSMHELRYGGDCPGHVLVQCVDDPDTTPVHWTNTLTSAQPVYYVQSGFATAEGTFTLEWWFGSDGEAFLYTPVPATATLSDARMCTGVHDSDSSFQNWGFATRSECSAWCNGWDDCKGFSWGVPAPIPSPSPPPNLIDRRRTLLAHQPNGRCYLSSFDITTSSVESFSYTQAGCYTKGAPDPSIDSDFRNGIMRAAMAGDTSELAVAIADPEQDINLMDNTTLGYNALMLAAQYDHQDVARMLLDAGADTSLLTSTSGGGVVIDSNNENNNWSNVMVAAWYGDQEIVSMFLDASMEHLNTPCDNKQMTPLHGAVSQHHCNTAAILIAAGANLNALDYNGQTPLHYAAKDGSYKCLMMLMNAGVNASIVDDMGNTAYTLAEAGDHQDIMAALSIGGYLLQFVAKLFKLGA